MPRQTRKRKRGIGGGQTDARRAEDWRLRERSASKARRDKLAVFRRSVKAHPNEPTKWIMNNARKKNPTKAQKREKARKASVARRVALSLAKYLKQVNPGMKTSGASIQKLKGGVLKITPIKANAGSKGPYYVENYGPIKTLKEAKAIAAMLRRQGHKGARVNTW